MQLRKYYWKKKYVAYNTTNGVIYELEKFVVGISEYVKAFITFFFTWTRLQEAAFFWILV